MAPAVLERLVESKVMSGVVAPLMGQPNWPVVVVAELLLMGQRLTWVLEGCRAGTRRRKRHRNSACRYRYRYRRRQ